MSYRLPCFLKTPIDNFGDHPQYVFLGVDDPRFFHQPVKSLKRGEYAEQLIRVREGKRLNRGEVNYDTIARRNRTDDVVTYGRR